jgi:GTP-binding protein
VVSRALKQGLKFVVVLNKADRDSARLGGEVESEIFDLLCSMDATEEQLEFPVIFASAKQVHVLLWAKNK